MSGNVQYQELGGNLLAQMALQNQQFQNQMALQNQQAMLSQQAAQRLSSGYNSPNIYGGFQVNPPQTQYAGDPSSLFNAMASVMNTNTNAQAAYDTAYGNAIWNRQNLLDELKNRLQLADVNNSTQRYGYDQQLAGQLGVADRNLQGQLGVADRNLQGELGKAQLGLQGTLAQALAGLQGQLGAANIGAQASNYAQDAQRQTALSGQQNALNIAGLQNSGETDRARIQADAAMLPANLKQQRFDQILPLFSSILGGLGLGTTTPASPSQPTPSPAAPVQAPPSNPTQMVGGIEFALPQYGAWSLDNPNTPAGTTGFHDPRFREANAARVSSLIDQNGRGDDPNLVGSRAWQERQSQAVATSRAIAAMSRPALTANMQASQNPMNGVANNVRQGVGLAGFNGAAANAALRQQLEQNMATGGSLGMQNNAYLRGVSPPSQNAYGGGQVSNQSNLIQQVQAQYGINGGSKANEQGLYGTSGTGPYAGGLPGGTSGPGAPGYEYLPTADYGTAGTGAVSGGLPMGNAGPGAPSTDLQSMMSPQQWQQLQSARAQAVTQEQSSPLAAAASSSSSLPSQFTSAGSSGLPSMGTNAPAPNLPGNGSNPFMSLISGMPRGPLINAQQQQQMMNSALAGNASAAAQQRQNAAKSFAARGWSPSSPALARTNNQIAYQQMNADNQARTQLPLSIAQTNGQYGLQTASANQEAQNQYLRALTGYYGAQSGMLSPILGALASFGA